MGAYFKKCTSEEDPTIQIDVVHGQEGSFLAFLSAEGLKRAKNYAGAVSVEVEGWTGRPSDRRVESR